VVRGVFDSIKALASITALVLLAVPTTATAGFLGKNGRIAISADWGCDGSYIQTVRPTGSGVRSLGPKPCNDEGMPDRYGSWTADGRTLLFNARIDPNGTDMTVMSMGPRGDDRHPLPVPDGYEPQPSPSGDRLVYERIGPAGIHRPDICTVNTDGSGLACLRVGHQPRFSPNGKMIAFVGPIIDESGERSRKEQGLWLMALDGTIVRRLTRTDVSEFDWSPTGRRLAFVKRLSERGDENDLYTINSGGKGRQRLTSTPRRHEFSPAWSPDGESIAFVRRKPGNDFKSPVIQVRKKPADGSARSRTVIRLPPVFDTLNGPSYPTTISWQARP